MTSIKNYFIKFIQWKKGGYITFFLAVFLLVAIRFLYCGFEYYPQLDDYIQHHNYAQQIEQSHNGDVGEFIKVVGILKARPLAGVLDITLWSWLWDFAIVGVILLSAMYALAAVEFNRIFERLFGTSKFFAVFFALFPLGIEGTYWMSASTRIIPGMLLTALSAGAFFAFLEKGKWCKLLLAFVFQLLTFGFYEQIAVLSCAFNLFLGLLFIKRGKKMRLLFAPMGILSAAVYFTFTSLVGQSMLYDGRTKIFTSIGPYYLNVFLPKLLEQLKSAFLGGGYYILTNGFVRGIKLIIEDRAVLYVLLIVALCALVWYLLHKNKGADNENTVDNKTFGKATLAVSAAFGLLMTLVPLAPFFIIEGEPWFSFRGTVPSFAGIALLCDTLLRLVTHDRKKIIAPICAAMAFVFCICSVSEISDYKQTYENDTTVVKALASIPREEYPGGGKIAIFNVDPVYLTEMNSHYHEHITGVTESSWALTGAVRCYKQSQTEWIDYIPISLQKDPIYAGWEYNTKTIGSMKGVYLYDNVNHSVERLVVTKTDEHRFVLSFEGGEVYGEVIESLPEPNANQYVGRFFEK